MSFQEFLNTYWVWIVGFLGMHIIHNGILYRVRYDEKGKIEAIVINCYTLCFVALSVWLVRFWLST